jgi:hypothetical protein
VKTNRAQMETDALGFEHGPVSTGHGRTRAVHQQCRVDLLLGLQMRDVRLPDPAFTWIPGALNLEHHGKQRLVGGVAEQRHSIGAIAAWHELADFNGLRARMVVFGDLHVKEMRQQPHQHLRILLRQLDRRLVLPARHAADHTDNPHYRQTPERSPFDVHFAF